MNASRQDWRPLARLVLIVWRDSHCATGWQEVTGDPALLRRLNAHTFAVLAVWDLTEVERAVIAGRQG